MRANFDEYILSYTVLRIDAGLRHIITSKNPEFLGISAKSIRGHWKEVSQHPRGIARVILNRDFVNWDRAERVGLTGEMLDLKRETLDSSLGRRLPTSEFNRIVRKAHNDAKSRTDFFSRDRILVREGSGGSDSREAFLDLAKDLLGSIAKILGIDDVIELIREFISVVEAAMKITGKA
jgi:hypothetical protein